MAFSIVSTNATKRTFKKVSKIIVTPLVDDGNGALIKADTAYYLDNIVADSTQITQDDPDKQTVDCETRDEPIDEAITLGSYKFTASNADWQDSLMTVLLGFTKDATTGVVYAPEAYIENYAEIELQFGDATTFVSKDNRGNYRGSIVLPKVLLSSAATLESLKTSTANMTISGTAYSGAIAGVSTANSPFYYSPGPVAIATT